VQFSRSLVHIPLFTFISATPGYDNIDRDSAQIRFNAGLHILAFVHQLEIMLPGPN